MKEFSDMPIEQKTERDFNARVVPFLKLAGLELNGDIALAIFERHNIFFTANPKYPKCPLRFWWSGISELVKEEISANQFKSKYFIYIMRNDNAVSAWANYWGIKINENE